MNPKNNGNRKNKGKSKNIPIKERTKTP
jgi:hypothetical protein